MKLYVITGTHPDTRQLMIYCEVYGRKESNDLYKTYRDTYPSYVFNMREVS